MLPVLTPFVSVSVSARQMTLPEESVVNLPPFDNELQLFWESVSPPDETESPPLKVDVAPLDR